MRKVMIIIAILFAYVFVLFVVNLAAFDPEAALQVSERIAEWRLMNKNKGETQVEPTVYVSSSLSRMVEKENSKGVGVVSGLMAFDNNYWIESQIRNWEQIESVEMSSKYMSRLVLHSNPWTDIAGDITIKAVGMGYQLGNPPPIASVTYNVASTVTGASITGIETINRIGTATQIINPPIYLNEKTPWGWKGQGFYPIQGGHVYYQETFKTGGPGPITRTHTCLLYTSPSPRDRG